VLADSITYLSLRAVSCLEFWLRVLHERFTNSQDGKKCNSCTVCRIDDSDHSCSGFPLFQTPISGTPNSKYNDCVGVCYLLFSIS